MFRLTVQEVTVKRDALIPVTSSSFHLEDDLIRLNNLNEAVISFNLEHRYNEDTVYVCLSFIYR